jgi:UPF0716 protein FxsA
LTLALVLVTAVIGVILLRQQGFQILERVREDVNAGRTPAPAMADGVLVLVAGILLLTPGFVTDAIGLLLFVPAIRDWIWRVVAPMFFARLSGSWSRWPGSYDGGTTYRTVIDIRAEGPDDPGDSGSRRR